MQGRNPKSAEKYRRSRDRNLARQAERRLKVEQQQARRDARTDQAQLDLLTERGMLAGKERARLEARLEAAA